MSLYPYCKIVYDCIFVEFSLTLVETIASKNTQHYSINRKTQNKLNKVEPMRSPLSTKVKYACSRLPVEADP